jgi:hypothetical protein
MPPRLGFGLLSSPIVGNRECLWKKLYSPPLRAAL